MTKNAGTEKRCEYSNSEVVFEYSERIRIFEYPLTSLIFSLNACLPYSSLMNTDIDYYQTFFFFSYSLLLMQ